MRASNPSLPSSMIVGGGSMIIGGGEVDVGAVGVEESPPRTLRTKATAKL